MKGNIVIDNNHFAYYLKEELGSGQYGSVYLANPIYIIKDKIKEPLKISETPPGFYFPNDIPFEWKFDEDNPIAIKIFTKQTSFLKKFLSENSSLGNKKLYKINTTPIVTASKTMVLLDYVPGQNLENYLEHDNLNNWSFHDRLDFCWQLCLQLNQLQHNTPKGEALIHRDIKRENIILKLRHNPTKDDCKWVVDANLIDFDFGTRISGDPTNMNKRMLRGSPYFMGPEFLVFTQNEPVNVFNVPEESDTFSLAVVFWHLLGAIYPEYHKVKISEKIGKEYIELYGENPVKFKKYLFNNILKTKLDPDGLLNLQVIPNWLIDDDILRLHVINFICKMGDEHYYLRPNSDKLLRFFTTLRLLNIIYQKDLKDEYSAEIIKYKNTLKELAPIDYNILIINKEKKLLLHFDYNSLPKNSVVLFRDNLKWSVLIKYSDCKSNEPRKIFDKNALKILNSLPHYVEFYNLTENDKSKIKPVIDSIKLQYPLITSLISHEPYKTLDINYFVDTKKYTAPILQCVKIFLFYKYDINSPEHHEIYKLALVLSNYILSLDPKNTNFDSKFIAEIGGCVFNSMLIGLEEGLRLGHIETILIQNINYALSFMNNCEDRSFIKLMNNLKTFRGIHNFEAINAKNQEDALTHLAMEISTPRQQFLKATC